MTELLPCPFCGSTELEIFANLVSCFKCDANGPMQEGPEYATDSRVAVEDWNRRSQAHTPTDTKGDNVREAGEPVGYLVKDYADGWFYEGNKSALEELIGQGHAMRPLYAHPAPEPSEQEKAIQRLLVTAKLLYANAEGCAINHHGADFEQQGLPGWLADARADIEIAIALIEEGR